MVTSDGTDTPIKQTWDYAFIVRNFVTVTIASASCCSHCSNSVRVLVAVDQQDFVLVASGDKVFLGVKC